MNGSNLRIFEKIKEITGGWRRMRNEFIILYRDGGTCYK
jgi:hypothetical protein